MIRRFLDWAIGDVAECISPGNWRTVWSNEPMPGPRRRQLLRVRVVFVDEGTVWLVFREFPVRAYPAGYFRKLRPATIEIECREYHALPEPELVE